MILSLRSLKAGGKIIKDYLKTSNLNHNDHNTISKLFKYKMAAQNAVTRNNW